MPIVDVDKIINGSPVKRINNAYNTMKENYNENTATDFYNVYSKEPLSAVLETSKSILSEPRNGVNFISKVTSPDICAFESSQDIYQYVNDYYNEHAAQMSDTQKEIYEKQLDHIRTQLDSMYNTKVIASYIKENIDPEFENNLCEILFSMKENKDENVNYSDEIVDIFEDVHPLIYFTFAPYATECMVNAGVDFSPLTEAASEYLEDMWSVDNKAYLFESIIGCNKLKHDKSYMEAVSCIPKMDRGAFEYLESASLTDAIDQFSERVTVSPKDIIHVSTESAVNNLFWDIDEGNILKDQDAKIKAHNNGMKLSAYEAVLDILHTEYELAESTNDIAYGYDFITENSTLEEAYKQVFDLCNSIEVPVTEADEEDVSDDDIDKMSSSLNEPDPTPAKEEPVGKKPSAPEVQKPIQKPNPDKLTKKTTKLMDKEAKKMAKQQAKEQRGLKRKMRFKAATATPRNAVKRVQQKVNQFDEMDDRRRKDYMTKPGFRKKWFRNLKLAIMYGTAASYKIAMLPVVAICRHFSKKKDRRMRNELVRELDTEIKIAEEKINDANAAGDQKEKYRCMRIKAQLEAERVRVASNSKYV